MLEQTLHGRSDGRQSSRRVVLKTAAWTAPAVAVAVGIPSAASASPAGPLVWTVTKNSFSGSSGTYSYNFTISVTSGTLGQLTVVWDARSGIGNSATTGTAPTATAFSGWAGTPSGTNTSGNQWTRWTHLYSGANPVTDANGTTIPFVGQMTAVAAGDVPVTISFRGSNTPNFYSATQDPVGTLSDVTFVVP